MSVTRIATRYAKSLLDLAVERGKLEVVATDIAAFKTAAQNKDLSLMLKSPIIPADKKNAVMEAIFKGKVDDLTMSYMALLINKGREPFLTEIASEFSEQFKKLKKITTIRVTTAAPMTEEVLDDLKKKILASGVTTENLEIVTQVDPELIGGFVLEFDNKRYDASVSYKLDQLKSQFSKNLYIKEF